MAKSNPSDSEADQQNSETSDSSLSSSSEEQDPKNHNDSVTAKNKNTMTEYEKQRLSRIADNKARMEALGLRKMASSLMGSMVEVSKGKEKFKNDDDDEYMPPDDDGMDIDDDDDDEDYVTSKVRKRMVKNKIPRPNKKASARKQMVQSELIDEDEDKELMQAIALSLQESARVPGQVLIKEGKGNSSCEDLEKKKRKKPFASRVKMTEDELIINFFQFDEAGKGYITARDLEKMALAHDFTWTDKELDDMIHYFDTDGNGQLSLDDFRNIVSRCNMIQD